MLVQVASAQRTASVSPSTSSAVVCQGQLRVEAPLILYIAGPHLEGEVDFAICRQYSVVAVRKPELNGGQNLTQVVRGIERPGRGRGRLRVGEVCLRAAKRELLIRGLLNALHVRKL